MNYTYRPLLLLFLLTISPLRAFDQSHFFQAPFFPEGPRFATKDLTSARLRFAEGVTHTRTDSCGAPRNTADNRYRIEAIVGDFVHNFGEEIYAGITIPVYQFHIREDAIWFRDSSLGNICLSIGWTTHYEACRELDFVDFSIETGVIAATANRPWQTSGVPLRAVVEFGLYDWLSTGLAADAVVFFDCNNGRLWDVSWFLKADHVVRGFSFGFGYTHSDQTTTPVPWSDEIVPFWRMNSFNFIIGYDLACETSPLSPEIEFFYNKVLDGKNVVRTPSAGISVTVRF